MQLSRLLDHLGQGARDGLVVANVLYNVAYQAHLLRKRSATMAPRSKAPDGPTKAPKTLLACSNSVLAEIMSWLSLHDLQMLMRTSRSLFSVGLSCVLRRRHALRHLHQLAPFCEYLAASSPARFSLLRDLRCDLWHLTSTFAPPTMPAEELDILVDILGHATNLTRLCVSAYVLRVLGSKAFKALGAMTKLRCLELYDHQMVSTPRVVVATDLASQFDSFTLEARGPERPSLRRVFLDICPDALEELVLRNVSLAALQTCYPRVTRLTCHPCRLPSLAVLVRAFPNVEVLSLWDVLPPKASPAFQDWERCRKANRAYQRAHPSAQLWRALAFFSASWATLFALELQCPVASLVLDLNGRNHGIWELANILEPLKLQHLRIVGSPFRPAKLVSLLFARGGLKTLRRLDFTINLSLLEACDDDEDDEVAIPAALEDLVAQSNIEMLDCVIIDSRNRSLHGLPPLHLNLRAISRQLAKASGTLSLIKLVLQTQSRIPNQPYYGVICRNGGKQSLREEFTPEEKSIIDGHFLSPHMPTSWHSQSLNQTYI